ncbi:signal peptidase I [Curtobacterium flaccumfaciens]|nr:signal peptidase I [Curtobacterium flaccumfaciens]
MASGRPRRRVRAQHRAPAHRGCAGRRADRRPEGHGVDAAHRPDAVDGADTPPGTLLVVRPTPVEDIQVGDVVTYQIVSGQPAVISHRVVSVSSSSDGGRTFVLKGDNNAEADPAPVTAVQIRGVLWYSVPEIGLVNQLVNGSRSWLIPLVAGVLLTYSAVMMTAGFVSTARRRRAGTGRGRRSAAHHVQRGTTETTTPTRSRLGGRDGRSAAGAGAPRRSGPTAPRRGRPRRSARRVRPAEGRPRDPS